MKIKIEIEERTYEADLSKPIDISIPLHPSGPRAWYVEKMRVEPVMNERFTGSVEKGGDVNFRNIAFNPHGHGTHTESCGHIDREVTSVNQILDRYLFTAGLITIEPEVYDGEALPYKQKGDRIVTKNQIASLAKGNYAEAIVLRTLPNPDEKKSTVYSGTNPPYLEPEALDLLREKGVKHLLLDLPSVDREVDGGKLAAHHRFWQGGREDDKQCTITEMVFIPNEISDGYYLLDLQTAPFENDATPSRPVLYALN